MSPTLQRTELRTVIRQRLQESRALALLGARQVGKTTLGAHEGLLLVARPVYEELTAPTVKGA